MATLTTGTNFSNSAANGYVIADGFSGPAGAAASFPNGTTNSGTSTFANGTLRLLGTSTGYTTLNSGLTSTSNSTLTLPTVATDTLVSRTSTDTLTNKTLTSPTITTPSIHSPVITGTLPRMPVAAPAAAGTNQATATLVTAVFNAVTGADATKGITLPATPAAGTWTIIVNTAARS